MALKQSFETFDGTGFTAYGATWRAQIFTTTSAYTVTDVALYGWKYGTPGNITVSIKSVDIDNKPTGPDLCSVTVDPSVVTTLPTLGWYTFTFDTSYALSNGVEYAIVVRTATGSTSHYYAPFGYGSSGYAGGDSTTSTDSGSTWGALSGTNDINFRVYGGAALPGKPTTPSPADSASDITLDQTPLGWVDGGNTDTYEIYYRASGDDWVLVGVSQAGITWTIPFGSIDYDTTYEWRVDATNVYGTTTGDTWSFDAITFDRIRASYVLISGGSGSGPYDDPPGVEGTDWAYTGLNFMTAIRRLVAAANDKIWYEDI